MRRYAQRLLPRLARSSAGFRKRTTTCGHDPCEDVLTSEETLRGYLLEEALAWLLRNSGYRLLIDESQDPVELKNSGIGLCVRGRGAIHQVDVLGEFAFTPAFSLPIRLFLEAKFTDKPTRLPIVRNAHGVIHDINENFVAGGAGQQLRKRFRYVYALFSASGFSKHAQGYALAHQISLIDLSGPSFSWLLNAVRITAEQLHGLQEPFGIKRFPVHWMRDRLRLLLGTVLDRPDTAWQPTETEAEDFAYRAWPIISQLSERLRQRQRAELLLGFPSAPFILPMATDDVDSFLHYVGNDPEHRIRLRRRVGEANTAEWIVRPDPEYDDTPMGRRDQYQLAFELPRYLEQWIGRDSEEAVSRTRSVKRELLADIVIYRMENDELRTFQLKYQPSDFRRG